MRKIIQITTNSVVMDDEEKFTVHALCDDGTIWWLNDNCANWKKLLAIPQDEKSK